MKKTLLLACLLVFQTRAARAEVLASPFFEPSYCENHRCVGPGGTCDLANDPCQFGTPNIPDGEICSELVCNFWNESPKATQFWFDIVDESGFLLDSLQIETVDLEKGRGFTIPYKARCEAHFDGDPSKFRLDAWMQRVWP